MALSPAPRAQLFEAHGDHRRVVREASAVSRPDASSAGLVPVAEEDHDVPAATVPAAASGAAGHEDDHGGPKRRVRARVLTTPTVIPDSDALRPRTGPRCGRPGTAGRARRGPPGAPGRRVAAEGLDVGEVGDQHRVGVARRSARRPPRRSATVIPPTSCAQPAQRLQRARPRASASASLGPGEDHDVTDHGRQPASRPAGPRHRAGYRLVAGRPDRLVRVRRMGRSLRIALLSYRSKPHSGGQGIYVRALSRELTELGHRVEVLSGQPYPELDDGVAAHPAAQPGPVPRARSRSAPRARRSSATGSTSPSGRPCAPPASPSR